MCARSDKNHRRAVTIVDAEELGGAMTEKLAELFDDKAQVKQAKTSTRRKVACGWRISIAPSSHPRHHSLRHREQSEAIQKKQRGLRV